MTFWREASTLIFALRPRLASGATKLSSDPSRAADYKVLMLRRSAQSSFMPSKLVFPGGVVQHVDHSGEWIALFKRITGRSICDKRSQLLPPSSGFLRVSHDNWTLPPNVVYRLCAIRETFEESGLLLATNRDLLTSGDPFSVSESKTELERVSDQRRKVEHDPEYFLQMCDELDVVPNIWALHDWRHWLTPVFRKVLQPPAKPKRFNTMFFLCCIDCDHIPVTSADCRETTQAEVRL